MKPFDPAATVVDLETTLKQEQQIRLMQGNCLELMKELPDASVDLCVSDIPYQVITGGRKKQGDNRPSGILEQNKQLMSEIPDFSEWLPDLYRVMKDGSHVYLMVNFVNLSKLLIATEQVGFKHINLLVWEKNNCTPSQFYMKNCEYTLLVRKGKARYINNIGASKTVHKFNNVRNKKHPTEKPEDLMAFYIKNSSAEGEIVLDPFMGSGTTGVACMNTGRRFIGIELDQEYFEIANERIFALTQ